MYKQGQHLELNESFMCFLINVWFLCLQDLVSFSVKDGEDPVLNKLRPTWHRCKFIYVLVVCIFLLNTATHSGQYDARARVLIRHVSCLLRVCSQQLEEFEQTLVEKLGEGGEESEWVPGGRTRVRWQIIRHWSHLHVHSFCILF